MGLFSNLTFPDDESVIEKWLLDNRDAVIAELKDYYEGCLDNCGPDDEDNTIPAKELYKKSIVDIVSCKDDIQAFYAEAEYWEKNIQEGFPRVDKEVKEDIENFIAGLKAGMELVQGKAKRHKIDRSIPGQFKVIK